MGTTDPETGIAFPSDAAAADQPTGTHNPATGTDDPERWAAVDWSHKGLHLTIDGQTTLIEGGSGTLRKWLESNPDMQVLIEPTFESFDLAERKRVIEQHGSRLHTVSSRWTEGERRRLGVDKSDVQDSQVIFSARERGVHLKTPSIMNAPDREWMVKIIHGRAAGWPKEVPCLPPPKDVPEDLKVALCENSRRYKVSFVWPLVIAAQHSATRAEFDRFVGAYGHGYPSVLRSNLYHHRVRAMEKTLGHKTAMQIARRAARWVFSQTRKQTDETLRPS
jgi:hypothetical protein